MLCCYLIFGVFSLILSKVFIMNKKKRKTALEWKLSDTTSEQDIKKKFRVSDRIKSFKYAFSGILVVIKDEHNARIHVAVSISVIIFCLVLGLSITDLTWVILAIHSVLFAETINTAFEHLCDVVSLENNPSIQNAKDIAAGAVLISVFFAICIGLLKVVPYIV